MERKPRAKQMTVQEMARRGGQARAARLSAERRREIAQAAGRASAATRAEHKAQQQAESEESE